MKNLKVTSLARVKNRNARFVASIIASVFFFFRKAILPLLAAFISVAAVYAALLIGPTLLANTNQLIWVEQLLRILQSISTIAAILIGGLWTYYKFVRGRTLIRKLESKLSCSVFQLEDDTVISVEADIKNIGNVRIPISHAYIIVGIASTRKPHGPEPAELTHRVDILTYLADNRSTYALEPNEDMHRLVTVSPASNLSHLARIDLIVESQRDRCWSATIVVPVMNAKDYSQSE